MSSTVALPTSSTAGYFADYLELTKPRISVMVLVTVAISYALASLSSLSLLVMVPLLLGTALVAASSSAANQWLERLTDARMPRTRNRPLPAGRLTGTQVLGFSAATFVSGVMILATCTNWVVTVCGVVTWLLYVAVYTPLKTRSFWNTAVGAISGALPMSMGWAASGSSMFDLQAVGLFLILFCWQFPHFMAIAWIYRGQYEGAGLKMITVTERTGRAAAWHAIVGAALLIPLSLIAVPITSYGGWVIAGAMAMAALQMIPTVNFFLQPDDATARRLLHASLIYLPCLLIWIVSSAFLL